jgi:acetolactate decarboxylase
MMKKTFICLAYLLFTSNFSFSQNSEVKFSGAMRNTMRMGQLQATINPDTISNKEGLCGIGPLENLKGEIMIIDGESFVSRVKGDDGMEVENTFNAPAPFFVYANIQQWDEVSIPKFVNDLGTLEKYLTELSGKRNKPFTFKLSGEVSDALIHIVNLPDGRKISSREQAHEGLIKFEIRNESCDLIGFFSTEHQTIFTHHDSYIHVHLINKERTKMGHLETLTFRPGYMKLYLPK